MIAVRGQLPPGAGQGHRMGHKAQDLVTIGAITKTQAAESCCVRPRGCLLGRCLRAEREERRKIGRLWCAQNPLRLLALAQGLHENKANPGNWRIKSASEDMSPML